MNEEYERVKRYTFDTCIGIKMVDNPNFVSLLSCRLDCKDSIVHLTSQTALELTRKGYDFASVSAHIHKCLGVDIVYTTATKEVREIAKCLQVTCPTLHAADSLILADSKHNQTTLVTCDRGLADAASLADVNVVNPDILASDTSMPNPVSRYACIVRGEQLVPTLTVKVS